MRLCLVCDRTRELRHFNKNRKVCYSCRYSKYDKGRSLALEVKEYNRKYYKDTKLIRKYKAYSHSDRVRDCCTSTLPKYEAIDLMRKDCHYCGHSPSEGLDRVDSKLNHSSDNVVPCCEKCNNILGDLPKEAKDILSSGLREIRQKEILNEWVIPTKRKK